MGLFPLITCDVPPEVYQCLITQVFLLVMIEQQRLITACILISAHENRVNLGKFALRSQPRSVFLWTNNKSHIDFDLLKQITVKDN